MRWGTKTLIFFSFLIFWPLFFLLEDDPILIKISHYCWGANREINAISNSVSSPLGRQSHLSGNIIQLINSIRDTTFPPIQPFNRQQQSFVWFKNRTVNKCTVNPKRRYVNHHRKPSWKYLIWEHVNWLPSATYLLLHNRCSGYSLVQMPRRKKRRWINPAHLLIPYQWSLSRSLVSSPSVAKERISDTNVSR